MILQSLLYTCTICAFILSSFKVFQLREGFILKKVKNDGIFHVGRGGVIAIPSWNYFFFVWVLNHPEMQ